MRSTPLRLSSLTSLCAMAVAIKRVNWKNLIFPLIGCVASTVFAVSFIKSQDSSTLKLLLGIALFLLSVYFFFFSGRIKIKPTWYAGLIAGILSGILGGMFSIGGPPVVIYFLQSEEEPEDYVATISGYFVFSGIISVGIKAAAGFVADTVLMGAAAGVLALLLGSFIGKSVRHKINPPAVKKCVYAVMAASGVINILTALL